MPQSQFLSPIVSAIRSGAGCISTVGPLGGGLAKSEVTMLEASLHALAGHATLLVESDPGLPLLTNCLDPQRYEVLSLPSGQNPAFAAALFEDAVEQKATVVTIDVGGNAMLDRQILHNLTAVFDRFKAEGWAPLIKLIIRPGKEGLATEVLRIARAFESRAEVRLIAVDVDGSGDFSSFELVSAMYPVHHVPHFEPALLKLVRRSRGLASDVILNPPEGFRMAVGWIARNLASFARSNDFAAAIGCEAALPILDTAAIAAPNRSFGARRHLWEVSDIALQADQDLLVNQQTFGDLPLGLYDLTFAQAAIDYHRALFDRKGEAIRARQIHGA